MARALARALPPAGWDVTLATGSLGRPGVQTHAPSFFAGLDVVAVDYSPGDDGVPFPRHMVASPSWNIHSEDRPLLMNKRADLREVGRPGRGA